MPNLPIIDISPLITKSNNALIVAKEIKNACREFGFFYIKNHGVSEKLQQNLENFSHQFFKLPLEEKNKIKMEFGGKAWRGYFKIGDELTSNLPDQKEGIYFGKELNAQNINVLNDIPLHGANLFPSIKNFKSTILEYISVMEELGHILMRGISLSLNLDEDFIASYYTKNPLILFRIFHYPNTNETPSNPTKWGVGEHTDYGVLTILKQDNVGGLQVKSNNKWIDAPPIPNTFACNIGDMLERMTKGYYISTPHRVLNTSGKSRLSYPFFFDPNFFAEIKPLPIANKEPLVKNYKRWDNANVHSFKGTYGDYLLNKIGKVFPDLKKKV